MNIVITVSGFYNSASCECKKLNLCGLDATLRPPNFLVAPETSFIRPRILPLSCDINQLPLKPHSGSEESCSTFSLWTVFYNQLALLIPYPSGGCGIGPSSVACSFDKTRGCRIWIQSNDDYSMRGQTRIYIQPLWWEEKKYVFIQCLSPVPKLEFRRLASPASG